MVNHSSHAGIEFKICFFLGHSWLIKINNVKLFLRDLAISSAKDYYFAFIGLHAKPCPRESSYCGSISNCDWFPNIILWLISFNHLFSKHWEVCLFSITWTADTTKDINRTTNCDHGEVWASMLHWGTLYPRRLGNCRIPLWIFFSQIWFEI